MISSAEDTKLTETSVSTIIRNLKVTVVAMHRERPFKTSLIVATGGLGSRRNCRRYRIHLRMKYRHVESHSNTGTTGRCRLYLSNKAAFTGQRLEALVTFG